MKNVTGILIWMLFVGTSGWPQGAASSYDFAAEAEELSIPGETVQQAAEKAVEDLKNSQMQINISTVGFDIAPGSEAEKMLQETARIGGGAYFLASNSGELAEALGSAATGQASSGNAAGKIIVLQPKDNDIAGPNIEIVGQADPSWLIVIYTVVYKADTGEKLRTVPGMRHRPQENGQFNFRIATPRIMFGTGDEPPVLRYELHVGAILPDGKQGPETIISLFSPKK